MLFVLPAHQDIMQKQINLWGSVCLEQFLLVQNMQLENMDYLVLLS